HIYLPLDTLKTWDPSILSDLDAHRLFCIDALDAVMGLPAWEEALFHLYNRIRDSAESTLIIASRTSPRQANIQLPDLQSRLNSGLVMQVQALSDTDKTQTLSIAAKRRGFELSPSAAQFLVHRSARNMHDLHALLDRLDHASLVAQRKITIPFIKTILNW
ncbi:MAG: DnaA/Hda family protein, partial [Legionella sp.]|nr:DnaA/Hda family protein [Legionella sp.]